MKDAKTKELADQIEELGRSIRESYKEFRKSSLLRRRLSSRFTRFPTEPNRKLRSLKVREA